jgi:hypothetical protein
MVNGAGHQFLSRARFTANKHIEITLCGALNLRSHVEHVSAGAQQFHVKPRPGGRVQAAALEVQEQDNAVAQQQRGPGGQLVPIDGDTVVQFGSTHPAAAGSVETRYHEAPVSDLKLQCAATDVRIVEGDRHFHIGTRERGTAPPENPG